MRWEDEGNGRLQFGVQSPHPPMLRMGPSLSRWERCQAFAYLLYTTVKALCAAKGIKLPAMS